MIVLPATLNTDSLAELDAGTANIFLATKDNFGYLLAASLHHSKTFSTLPGSSSAYFSSSLSHYYELAGNLAGIQNYTRCKTTLTT